MNVDLRKRGSEHHKSCAVASAPAAALSLRSRLKELRRSFTRPRSRKESVRLLCLVVGIASLLFLLLVLVALVSLHPSVGWGGRELVEKWLQLQLQPVCAADTLLHVPALRHTALGGHTEGNGGHDGRGAPYAFAVANRSGVPGAPTTVQGLSDFCAARVAEVPPWAAGSWRQWRKPSLAAATLTNFSALFNLTINGHFLRGATYTAVGDSFCFADGALYMTKERIAAGGVDVFAAEGMSVLPLTDAVLQRAAAVEAASAGVHVVPSMGLMVAGYWISTHFFHLVTDALEGLYSAFHNMEQGVLQRIPTQTVLVHRSRTSWLDRRGDQPRKMEFSAALTNSFSSPAPEWRSPYSTSFIFRPSSKECAGQSRRGQERRAPGTTFPSTAVASAVCFCDGLLVTRQNPAYMDFHVFYGMQDYAARQFDALPYVADRSVSQMEALRLAHTPPEAARFWQAPSPPAPTFLDTPPGGQAERERGAVKLDASTPVPAPSYAPRVLFVHRTTRLIANATRYAAWMREAGFRVEEVYLEKLSAAQQYYLGRYADVVVAMHGLGIGHAMWMEREPYACRTVIEFRPWVIQSMPLQPLRVLGQSMKFNFLPLFPIDVQFGPSVTDPEKERELLLSFERVNSAFSFPSFTDQTAVFDDDEVRRTILHVRDHLKRCLPR